MNEQIITALDIGSKKIFAISGLLTDSDIQTIGAEVLYPSTDVVKQGRIVAVDDFTNEILELFERMHQITEEKITWVVIGVSGPHVYGQPYQETLKIEPSGREITEEDIQEIERRVRAQALGEDQASRLILHVLPQEYIIDYQGRTRKAPLGLHAHTLESRVHIITAAANPVQDIMHCLKKIGIEVEYIYPNAWAAAEAVVTDEEKRQGTLVIDLGHGTTNLAIYKDNCLVTTFSLPVGGIHIDNDLCALLHVPGDYAEEIKRNHGYCNYENLVAERNQILSEEIEAFTVSGRLTRKITVGDVSRIVTDRVQDILENFVLPKVERTRLLPRLSAGVVITGGGARLKGILKLCEQVFRLPVRIGVPRRINGLDRNLATPAFSVGIGLLLLAAQASHTSTPSSWWERLLEKLGRKKRK
ncbi:MAG: cell division protein FtsA [Candidatus Omnitrophica bacterium]|nr:cell division protein FtsA [Candidatus Omnitrophota bacterium]